MTPDPADLDRMLTANQPPPAVLIAEALGGDVGAAARVLAALQRHYELKPR